ncbi:hypothetical protein ACFQ9X_25150 [Catenulispora yoronensis]
MSRTSPWHSMVECRSVATDSAVWVNPNDETKCSIVGFLFSVYSSTYSILCAVT